MTNLDSILKSKDITLLIKVCIVKSMVFPVVMYRCETWTIKNNLIKEFNSSECQRINAIELVLEKTLDSPLTARRSNQSTLKEISPEYSLQGLMLNRELGQCGP